MGTDHCTGVPLSWRFPQAHRRLKPGKRFGPLVDANLPIATSGQCIPAMVGLRRGVRRVLHACGRLVGLASLLLSNSISATEYERAHLATNAQHAAAWANDTFNGSTAALLVRTVAGAAGRQDLLRVLGNFSAAIDAPALANDQWTEAAAIAHQRGDVAAEMTILAALARSAIVLGEYDEALTFAEREARLAQRSGDISSEGVAENVRGIVARRRGRLDAALHHQEHALALFQSDSNVLGAMRALADLGTIWRDRGDYARALELQLDAADGSEPSGVRLEIIYRNIALLYREIEDALPAREYFQRALELAARHGVPSVYSSIIGSYAGLFNDVGEYANARDAAEEALAIDTARGDRPHQGLEHLEVGRALLGLGQDSDAVAHLEQALQLGRELGQHEISAPALVQLGRVALQRNDRLRAHTLIDEAIADLESAKLRPQLAQAYALRERLALAEHDDVGALRFAHKYGAARDELLGTRASRQLAALEARHVRALAQERVALLNAGSELKLARFEAQAVQWRLGVAAFTGLLVALLALVWRYRVVRRLNNALDARNTEIETQRTELAEVNATLRMQAAKLKHAATTDSLTGTLNRRGLLQQLEQRFGECIAQHRELAVMLIDFDHFKSINDSHGHLTGDRALIAGARIMRGRLGKDDLLGRFGGEEFVAVLRDLAPEHVLVVGERLRAAIAAELVEFATESDGQATISIGIAFLSDLRAPTRAEGLLAIADRRLYQAKSAGRNQVIHRDSKVPVAIFAASDA